MANPTPTFSRARLGEIFESVDSHYEVGSEAHREIKNYIAALYENLIEDLWESPEAAAPLTITLEELRSELAKALGSSYSQDIVEIEYDHLRSFMLSSGRANDDGVTATLTRTGLESAFDSYLERSVTPFTEAALRRLEGLRDRLTE
jgi:hypothetical protein